VYAVNPIWLYNIAYYGTHPALFRVSVGDLYRRKHNQHHVGYYWRVVNAQANYKQNGINMPLK
jgi:hypothetical protein